MSGLWRTNGIQSVEVGQRSRAVSDVQKHRLRQDRGRKAHSAARPQERGSRKRARTTEAGVHAPEF